MKPFNLEAAKRGDPLVTRDGRGVSEFHHFETVRMSAYVCVAVIDGERETFTMDGKNFENSEYGLDLFMAPKTRTVFLNVYASRLQIRPGNEAATFDTPADAAQNAARNGAKLLKIAMPIEIEE